MQLTSHYESHSYTTAAKTQPSLMLALSGSDEYATLAQHIADVYQRTYGADIEVTYPLLLGLMSAEEKPLAALGIRCAAEESPLFLEHYLDHPAEHYAGVPRHVIAEAGNLASTGKNDILMLLYGLACHLEQEGITAILFTGTRLLARYLNSLGLHPQVLAEANPARLGADASRWGSYYMTKPAVMAGSVQAFRQGLERYFRRGK